MTTPPRRTALFAFAALAALSLGSAAVQAADPLVVVELFTSQGCSTCPPADALLGRLAQRDDVIALAYHVDYWDYIGWRDRFGSAANTQRQRGYATWLGTAMIYTPQMMIAGRYDVMGARSGEVEAAVTAAQGEPMPLSVAMPDYSRVTISGPSTPVDAVVLAVIFQAKAETAVAAGENTGRTLTEYNIVRETIPLGRYGGGTQELALDPAWLKEAGYDGCAVLVQDAVTGRMLGAATLLK